MSIPEPSVYPFLQCQQTFEKSKVNEQMYHIKKKKKKKGWNPLSGWEREEKPVTAVWPLYHADTWG